MTISTARFLALADSLGYQYEAWQEVNDSDEADLVRAGADANVGRVVAYGSADAALIALLIRAANTAETRAATLTKDANTIFGDLVRALNTEAVLGEASIDAYLTANGIEVGPNFAALYTEVYPGQALSAANVDIGRTEGI
jgi:hypothetical protein